MGTTKTIARPFVFLAALTALLAQDHLKYGAPACGGPLLDKKHFVVCHDPDRRIPKWVGYSLSRQDLSAANADRREGGFRFRADPELPRGKRGETADYTNSGYDRGHMAPAADFKRSEEAMRATFVLSNAVPQKHGINGGQWSRLEAAVRSLADSHGLVWVFSGPVFAGKKPMRAIGKNKVAVPTHTFKVILCVHEGGRKEMFAFVMPNLDKVRGEVRDFSFSVNYVERLAGLDFFDGLPAAEERRLERVLAQLPGP